MKYDTIVYKEEKNVGLLTLNRPEALNALNQRMIEELEHLFDELAKNETARVLILTGAGEKGFCSGLDMKETAPSLFEQPIELIYKYQSRTSQL